MKKKIISYFLGFVLFFALGKCCFLLPIGEKREFDIETKYWEDILKKYQTEITTLETYYDSIESWDFMPISYWWMGRDCVCMDPFERQYYPIKSSHPVSEFLEFMEENRDFPGLPYGGGIIQIWGDLSSRFGKRVLEVRIYNDGYISLRLIYSPNGYPDMENLDSSDEIETELIGDGWYWMYRRNLSWSCF